MTSKMLLYQEERIREPPENFPRVILLDTTNACNLTCSMCAHRFMKRKVGVMSMDLYRKIIDEVAEVNPATRVWMTFFGEALIIKHKLFEMVKYAKKKGLKDVVLNSNGTLLDEEAAILLVRSGLDAIYIGIDAITRETYQKLRVGGDYEKVVNNTIRLLEIKKRFKSSHPKVYVQFVEMEENKAEREDFIKFWIEKGANVKVRPKVTWAGKVKEYGMKLAQKDRYPCHWGMQSIAICWDGRVALCAVDLECEVEVGNVNKESIRSIWMGKHRELRKLQLEGKWDLLPEFCRKCKDWQAARSQTYEACS